MRPRTQAEPVDSEAELNAESGIPALKADPVQTETGEGSMAVPSTGGAIDAGTCRQNSKNVLKSFSGSDQEFRRILAASAAKGSLVGVYFKAAWCGNCAQMTPAMQQMASDYPYVEFLQMDVDDEDIGNTLQWCGPRVLPTVKVFRGSDVVGEVEGVKIKNLADLIREFEGAVPEKCSHLRSATACVGLMKNNIRVCSWDEDGKESGHRTEVAPITPVPTRVAPVPATQSAPKATPQTSDPATTKKAPEMRSNSASQSFLVLVWIPIIVSMR